MKTPFNTARGYAPSGWITRGGVERAANFGDVADEYRHARDDAGVVDRSYRALLVVTGKDRQGWLHNVVTNDIKKLADGAGCYAFACDVKGRVQFDLNVLALSDRLWLDVPLDRRDEIARYLDRYLISEDAKIAANDEFVRLGLIGPRAATLFPLTPLADIDTWPTLSHRMIAPDSANLPPGIVRAVRHDFAGAPGWDLFVSAAEAPAAWDALIERGARAIGATAVEALRIEAGLPEYGSDIDDKTIAPDTAQAARAISYSKGCYLGQEVVERMRSLGTPARRLVRLRVGDGAASPPVLTLPAPLRKNGADAGRITSLIMHPLSGAHIGLGYVRTSIADPSGITVGDPPLGVTILD